MTTKQLELPELPPFEPAKAEPTPAVIYNLTPRACEVDGCRCFRADCATRNYCIHLRKPKAPRARQRELPGTRRKRRGVD